MQYIIFIYIINMLKTYIWTPLQFRLEHTQTTTEIAIFLEIDVEWRSIPTYALTFIYTQVVHELIFSHYALLFYPKICSQTHFLPSVFFSCPFYISFESDCVYNGKEMNFLQINVSATLLLVLPIKISTRIGQRHLK